MFKTLLFNSFLVYGAYATSEEETLTLSPRLTGIFNLSPVTLWDTVLGGRIIGGESASSNQLPYQAYLVVKVKSGWHSCGGVITNQTIVVTAAHCVDEGEMGIVVFGTTDLRSKKKQLRMFYAKDIIMHPNWSMTRIVNDIALIKLENPIKFNSDIKAIPLPDEKLDPTGKVAWASGWGSTINRNQGNPEELKYVNLTVISLEECKRYWYNFVDSSKLCTMSPNSGTCSGDSGGPLTNLNPFSLIGITSFGASNCRTLAPDVFTNVAYFIPWIKENAV